MAMRLIHKERFRPEGRYGRSSEAGSVPSSPTTGVGTTWHRARYSAEKPKFSLARSSTVRLSANTPAMLSMV